MFREKEEKVQRFLSRLVLYSIYMQHYLLGRKLHHYPLAKNTRHRTQCPGRGGYGSRDSGNSIKCSLRATVAPPLIDQKTRHEEERVA